MRPATGWDGLWVPGGLSASGRRLRPPDIRAADPQKRADYLRYGHEDGAAAAAAANGRSAPPTSPPLSPSSPLSASLCHFSHP